MSKDHWQRCDHERTPENSASSGHGSVTCKTCKTARDKVYGRRGGKASAAKKKARTRRNTYRRTAWLNLLSLPHSLPIASDTGRSYAMAPRRSA